MTFKSHSDGPLQYTTISKAGTPSWKRYGEGRAEVQFQTHRVAKYLSISMYERSVDSGASKTTMITLDREEALAVYWHLAAVFGANKGEAE